MSAELSKLAFEEMRSQAQQEEDDFQAAIRLSILEAEENCRRHQKEQQDVSSAASSALSHSRVSSSETDSWEMELEAARQREQHVRPSQPLTSFDEYLILFFYAGSSIFCDGATAGCCENGYHSRVSCIIGVTSICFFCPNIVAHFATAARSFISIIWSSALGSPSSYRPWRSSGF